jgi:hypothetical protein
MGHLYRRKGYTFPTMHTSFEEMCEEWEKPDKECEWNPWVPLGIFSHGWYDWGRGQFSRNELLSRREAMVAEPLPVEYPVVLHPWAAFCAASVYWYCNTYEVNCPNWPFDPKYILADPWCFDRDIHQDTVKLTPPEFARYNIFCGNSVFTNKYEFWKDGFPLASHPIDLRERREIVRYAAVLIENPDQRFDLIQHEHARLREKHTRRPSTSPKTGKRPEPQQLST